MKKIKLRWQIIIAIVIVSFLSVTISIFSVYRISVKTIRKQYIQQSEDKLSALNALVDKELDNLVTIIRKHMLDEDVLNAISNPPAVFGTSYFDTKSKDNIQKQVRDMVTQVSKIQGVFLFDDYGRYFMQIGNGQKEAPYHAYYTTELDKDAAWYKAVENSKGKEIFWNGDVLNPENEDCFSVVKKINDTTKYKPHGILIVTVSKSFLETLCGDLNFKNMVMLVDESSDLMFGIGDRDQTKTSQLYSSYQDKDSGKNQYLFLESKNQTTGWKFVAGIRNDELYSGSTIFEAYILLLTAIMILAVLLVSTVVATSIYKPLGRLEAAVEEINSGKRQIETQFDDGEIGKIGNTIKRVINNNIYLEKKVMESELSRKKSQYLLLQSQINPHYLYNTLDSIYILTLKHHVDDIGQMVLALSQLFRVSLNEGRGYVFVKDEIHYLEDYMTIMNYRFQGRFQVLYDIEDEVMECYMLKFILQPFVENSIIHGLEPKVGEGTVIVSGYIEDGYLEFKIYDDGVGFDTESQIATSYGIRNVKERLELTYGNESSLKIRSTIGEGTTVVLKIPIKNEAFYIKNEQ